MTNAAQESTNDHPTISDFIEAQLRDEKNHEAVNLELHKNGWTKPKGFWGEAFHGVEHLVTPGAANKVEGIRHVLGDAALCYVGYKLGKLAYRKISGGNEVGAALP